MSGKQEVKLYYAFYSEESTKKSMFENQDIENKGNRAYCLYRLADDESKNVRVTAVYLCNNYSTPQEVLEKSYKFNDAVFVGVVDKWIQTIYT